MIYGKKIYLDTIEQEDLEQLRIWRNNPEYRKYFREYQEISRDMQKNWYQTKVIKDDKTLMFAIREIESNELVGCCGLCYINWVNKNADVSIYIGKNKVYIDNEGMAEESCKLMFEYGFEELGLEKVWTELYEFDTRKINLFKKMGFQQDGELRNNYFHAGKWWNSYILSLLREEWEKN